MKHALDTVAEVLGVDDRVFRPWTLDFGEVDRPHGSVVLTLRSARMAEPGAAPGAGRESDPGNVLAWLRRGAGLAEGEDRVEGDPLG